MTALREGEGMRPLCDVAGTVGLLLFIAGPLLVILLIVVGVAIAQLKGQRPAFTYAGTVVGFIAFSVLLLGMCS